MFNAPGQFTVESQDADHPFYMSGYMTGCSVINPSGNDCRGDPEFVNVVPPDQFLKAYTFFTDPTYPETNLVLTRERDGGQFADVTLDCVGTVTGWQPIDRRGQIEYTRVDLVTGNFQGVGNCNNGLHVASSANKFGLVVWGWGSAATGLFQSTVRELRVSRRREPEAHQQRRDRIARSVAADRVGGERRRAIALPARRRRTVRSCMATDSSP